MHTYNVHEAFYFNCKIHDPSVRVSLPRVGPVWIYSEMCLENFLLYSQAYFRKSESIDL